MTSTTKLIENLHSICETGYGEKLPGPYYDTFVALARAYDDSDSFGKEKIRDAIPANMRMLLLGFGDRLATLADRTSDKELLWLAFLAHSIEDFRHDERENVFRLALLYHVAGKLGLEPSTLSGRVAKVSSERSSDCFKTFDGRPSELKSLEAMKIIEEQTGSGVNYRYG